MIGGVKMEKNKEADLSGGMGFVFGLALGAIACWVGYSNLSDRVIPLDKEVQQGYIAPSRIEVECKDVDGIPGEETYIKIDDKGYLLIEEEGKPLIADYEIKPVEIIIKE